jgi:hypothetical protein
MCNNMMSQLSQLMVHNPHQNVAKLVARGEIAASPTAACAPCATRCTAEPAAGGDAASLTQRRWHKGLGVRVHTRAQPLGPAGGQHGMCHGEACVRVTLVCGLCVCVCARTHVCRMAGAMARHL